MVRKVVWSAVIVILLLVGALASLLAYQRYERWVRERNSPYNQPGTVWTDSVIPMGYGTDLILLRDGTYAATNVCDICGNNFLRGTWRQNAKRILLTPAKNPTKSLLLVKEERSGCEFLRDNTQRLKNHPVFVKRSSQQCKTVLLNEIRARYENQ